MAIAYEPRQPEEFWLFGYGSLIWKPPPHFGMNYGHIGFRTSRTKAYGRFIDRRIPGYVEGYVRRFWQASEDHRGTPAAPGRVVTLIERSFWRTLVDQHDIAENRVWGAAYRIESSKVAEVQDYLDIREINGYSIQYAQFHPENPSVPRIKCLVYIGLPDNPQFMGAQDPQALAEHIVSSVGPSGENKEYLFMLEKALVQLGEGSGDSHVQDLAARVRQIDTFNGNPAMQSPKRKNRVQRGINDDQQEEVEKPLST